MDPLTGTTRSLIAAFFNKKWFFVSQRSDLTLIDAIAIKGAETLFATNGTTLYKLFSDSTVPVAQKIVTKLWDMGVPVIDKRSLKFGLEVINPVSVQTITGTIDTEISSNYYPFSLIGGNYIYFVNNVNSPITFANSQGASIQFISSGYAFLKADVQTSGKYLGATLIGNSTGTNYSGIHLQYLQGATW